MNNKQGGVIRETACSRLYSDSETPELSILIPTYNRCATLGRTLAALEGQGVDYSCYEVVVVDDGSSDETAAFLSTFADKTKQRFCSAVLNENGGPARARNIGTAMCRGSVILNLGDDIEPSPSMVARQLSWHKGHPDEHDALLGLVTFPDELLADPFMDWLQHGGRKYYFNYMVLQKGCPVGPLFFYTCNVSLKASLLEKSGGFDESFPFASHEDLELGYRLVNKGMRLMFDPEVRGCHWHRLAIGGITRRVYLMGYSAHLFWKKVGMEGPVWRRILRKMITFFCSTSLGIVAWQQLRTKKYSRNRAYPLSWHLLLFLSFFVGLSDADNDRSVRPELTGK